LCFKDGRSGNKLAGSTVFSSLSLTGGFVFTEVEVVGLDESELGEEEDDDSISLDVTDCDGTA
jgi:hypothetical protein